VSGVGRLNVVLGVAFVASLGLMWASRRDVHQPNMEFFPDMAHAPRYGAFEPNPVFHDGKTQQAAPAETIARGWLPLHYGATPAEATRAGAELRNAYAAGDASALARGEQVFASFCVPCHGAGARGDGLAAARGVPPPPSLVAGRAVTLPDGQLFHILTYGQNNMASYASQITREDRWRVILYVRSLQARTASAIPATQP
jgi:mono/diheme cytochrome c family protein